MDKKLNRSSKTGKFVTPKFAKKHKATTETERVASTEGARELIRGAIRLLNNALKSI